MSSKQTISLISASVCAFILVMAIALPTAAQSSITIQIADSYPYRILQDPEEPRYWIVDREHGLLLLWGSQPDTWHTASYPIGDVRDATGPDSNGRLYCTFGGDPAGIFVFDCASRMVIESIPLDRYPRGLVLSPDETMLYVCAFEWPLLGERGEHTSRYVTQEHRDAGRVFEVDIATHQILRTVTVGALPETIHYFASDAGDRLCVSTAEYFQVRGGPANTVMGEVSKLDTIDLDSFERIEPGIEYLYPYDDYTADLIAWPGEPALVALCSPNVGIIPLPGHEGASDAIWLVDPMANTVVETLYLGDASGRAVGIKHALISQLNSNEVYVSLGDAPYDLLEWVLVVDRETGSFIRSLDTGGPGFVPQFMHETLNGHLIVTGGLSEKIMIFDPPE